MGIKIDTKIFIERAMKIHGDKYDYSESEYISCKENVRIFCKKCNKFFENKAFLHLRGERGCPICARNNRLNSIKVSRDDFIKRSIQRHGDIYDYTLVRFNLIHDKIKIICKKCKKIFIQHAYSHMHRSGCPKCSKKNTANKITKTNEKFIEECIAVHGSRYDYSFTKYEKSNKKVIIKCDKHGKFLQTPTDHLFGYGCRKCGREIVSQKLSLTQEEFITKAKKRHGDKYSYEKSVYHSSVTAVEIFCKKCKDYFFQSAGAHLNGSNCPRCCFDNTQIERFIESFLKENRIAYKKNDRTILKGLEIDFLLYGHKIGIECNGLYWHSESQGKLKSYHIDKTNVCNNYNIQLIHIFENEIISLPRIVISQLKNILNLNKYRIFARKCEAREISTQDKNRFLEKYHLQGSDKSSVKLGLFYRNRLVAVMTFCKNRKALGKSHIDGGWELSRFAPIANFSIIGGAGKLLKYFERNWSPKKIISHTDKRWPQGNLYERIGFSKVRESKPNYWYFKGQGEILYHRFNFRKSELCKKLNKFDPNKTEWENMKENGWNRIWDCGNLIFEKEYN